MMPADKGNKYWLLRESHGRPKKIETADDLWGKCVSYFEWVEKNPIIEPGVKVLSDGVIVNYEIPHPRVMTLGGLCLFLGICRTTWKNYASADKDYMVVVRETEEIITNQKLSGAAAGLFKENIIMRNLGMVDKQQREHVFDVKDIYDQVMDIAKDEPLVKED